MSSLSEDMLRQRYAAACARLDVTEDRCPFRSRRMDDGSAHVEISGNLFYYVVTERGSELERRSTHDADELLYWLLSDVTFDLALEFELEHRAEGADSRRLLFSKQLELLHSLDPRWERRCAREIDRVLEQHPFRD